MYRFGIVVLSLLGSQLTFGADAPKPAKPLAAWEQKMDISGIVAHVPELKHPMPKGWQPTLYWEGPALSLSDPAKLKTELAELWKRGIVPRIPLSGDYNSMPYLDQAVTEAKAIADAGLPVNIQMGGGLNLYSLEDNKTLRHADMPEVKTPGFDIPCVTIKTGWKRRGDYIRSLYKKFVDAKIPVAAVWFDYEGSPCPWNGQFECAQACPTCRKLLPPDVLKNFDAFKPYVYNMNLEAIDEAFGQPAREAFPKAQIGQYGFTPSSQEHPTCDPLGTPLPFCPKQQTTVFDVSMPILYGIPHFIGYNPAKPMSQAEADRVYFHVLLRNMVNVHYNLRPDQWMMSFVGRWVDVPATPQAPVLGGWMYREILRHMMLRGTKGIYCFCIAPPPGMPWNNYYDELSHVVAVCNEFFAYPEFFEKGKVLNDALPAPRKSDVTWSGLGLPDKALIRTLALGHDTAQVVEITPFPGVSVRLLAPPQGQTYIVERSGQVRTVE